jgi:hypothetical protein
MKQSSRFANGLESRKGLLDTQRVPLEERADGLEDPSPERKNQTLLASCASLPE